MTNTEALNHLARLAKGGKMAYHPGYEQTVEYAAELKAYFADVEIEKYIRRFARRESEDAFKQSLEITSPVGASLGNMLENPFAKVYRSNWQKVVIVKNDEDGKKAAEFERDTLAKFGRKGFFPYIFERLRFWNIYDPNCFVIVEFDDFDNQRQGAEPYPYEATASDVVDFRFLQNLLDFVCTRKEDERADGPTPARVERLTMYRPLQTVVLEQVTNSEARALGLSPNRAGVFTEPVQNGDSVLIGDKIYLARIPLPHNCQITPAIRAGYIDNPADNGQTVLSIFHPALPFAKILLKINREMQNAMALLAFPISIRHQEVCEEIGCTKGEMPDGSTCMACHGTGWKPRPTGVAEEYVLPLPDRPEDMFDVGKIITYSYPPPESIQLQIDQWKMAREEGVRSVFNSISSTKEQVAQTATYHAIDLQSVYDAIWPYGRHISECAETLSRVIGDFTKYPMAVAKPLIPTDLRFETTEQLFAELEALRRADGGSDAAAILQTRVMEGLLRDNPEALARWKVEDSLNPFRGLTESQVLEALNSGLIPESRKVFFVNRAEIFAELAIQYPDFYRFTTDKQRALIAEKVAEIQVSIEQKTPKIQLSAATV